MIQVQQIAQIPGHLVMGSQRAQELDQLLLNKTENGRPQVWKSTEAWLTEVAAYHERQSKHRRRARPTERCASFLTGLKTCNVCDRELPWFEFSRQVKKATEGRWNNTDLLHGTCKTCIQKRNYARSQEPENKIRDLCTENAKLWDQIGDLRDQIRTNEAKIQKLKDKITDTK